MLTSNSNRVHYNKALLHYITFVVLQGNNLTAFAKMIIRGENGKGEMRVESGGAYNLSSQKLLQLLIDFAVQRFHERSKLGMSDLRLDEI